MFFLKKADHRLTVGASFFCFVTQACCLNFLPLLFVTLHENLNISLPRITGLISVSFITQLCIDWICSLLGNRINLRIVTSAALFLCAAGLSGLAYIPDMTQDPYIGILLCVLLYSVGGGILEVTVSPVVENCPTKNKPAMMSLLHSFYSWGSFATILLSTLFFLIFGLENYKILALFWALIPFSDGILFIFVPIYGSCEEIKSEKALMKDRRMLFFMFVMFCAGASEQAMSQWASAFAENALHIDKTVGDLLGPCAFALLMGLSRLLYSLFSNKKSLKKVIFLSGILCFVCYLTASLLPFPIFGLIGCALCGFSVGVMWPGTYSIGASEIKGGGTALFAMLALGGDLGCFAGPALVGFSSSLFKDNLSTGLLLSSIFPLMLSICMGIAYAQKKSV